MARKKDVQEQRVDSEIPAQEKSEPVYLRETLFWLDEIKQFGLNQYFLRAILPDKYYTLKQAKELIRKAL